LTRRLKPLLHRQNPPARVEFLQSAQADFVCVGANSIRPESSLDHIVSFDQEFLDGTSPRIYPWNQSKISNLKSSSPRIYPWGRLSNLKSQI